ncbi:MAG TPA: T9SS type A sorting domain-containing protein [Chitinophagaceae bacterium]|nr:T9SS type A sorting domain-containing protein [Chitinophagaceae bacterium]
MKKFLLFILALFASATLRAQTLISCESFGTNNGNKPSGWVLSQGAKIEQYNNPDASCLVENGIVTPGVGGNNPANVLTPTITSPFAGANIFAGFDIWAFDANLNCSSRKTQFLCVTVIDIFIVPSTYNSTTEPTGSDILGSYLDFPLTNTGTYGIIVNLPVGVNQFKLLFRFGAQDQNCNQPGIKYVLDNFCFYLTDCQLSVTCPPIANDDQFNLPTNNVYATFKGNLYGSNLAYTPPATYETRSLPTGPGSNAVNDGFDGDPDNHPQPQMTWSLINANTAATYGTVTLNPDGTFSFVRNGTVAPSNTLVNFIYQVKDPTNLKDTAVAYILVPSGGGLPVKFASFSAQQYSDKVVLKWQTAQELNNKEFEVQRKFSSGYFQTIATVPSKALYGNSGISIDYTVNDAESLVGRGQVFYRIKQVDLDAKESYSEIRSIRNNSKKFSVLLYPNPGKDLVKVTIPEGAGIVDIYVNDISGKEVKRWNATSLKNIQLTNLKPGIYTIRVNVKETGDVLVNKLVIQ